MQIIDNSAVSYHYQMRDAHSQQLLESSCETSPKQYIHGVSDMLDSLVAEFAGKSQGDKFEVLLPPEKAYGHYNKEAVGRISLKHVALPGGQPVRGKLKPGTQVEINTPDGVLDGTVIKQGLKMVDIDLNHPYAGKSLLFSVEIVDVRLATEYEIAQQGAPSCSCC